MFVTYPRDAAERRRAIMSGTLRVTAVHRSWSSMLWYPECAELANRGLRDVLIVCCDGLAEPVNFSVYGG